MEDRECTERQKRRKNQPRKIERQNLSREQNVKDVRMKKSEKKMFRRDIERLKKMENLNNNNKKRMNKRKYQLKKTQENGKRKQG